jgi:ethanolamine utilization protein EutP (predicted NTPase)
VDLKVPITITDELSDEVIQATGSLNLASGEIGRVEYIDYDSDTQGLPFENDDYEFSSGTLSNNGKDVEFKVDVNKVTGQYSVSPSELLEIKVRAAALFAGVTGKDMVSGLEHKARMAAAPAKPAGSGKGRLH